MTIRVDYDPVVLFDSVHGAFRKASATSADRVVQDYLVAGRPVRIQVASRRLADRMLPALESLIETTPEAPELTICAWDTQSTGVPLPDLPWYTWMDEGLRLTNSQGQSFDHIYTPRGDIRGHHDQRILGRCGEQTYSFFDADRKMALFWCADADELPWYEIGAPFRTEFNWWLRRAEMQLIHAGAVGTADRCALIAGKGGSGKSTTALTCLVSELSYISDDYCLLETHPTPRCHTLYTTAKVFYDNLHRVPHIDAHREEMQRTSQEKALFYVNRVFPEKIVPSLPVHCILLPQVTGQTDTGLEPASERDALSAIVLSTVHQMTGAGKEVMTLVQDLVRKVPSYHLLLGTDMTQIPDVIRRLLATSDQNGVQPSRGDATVSADTGMSPTGMRG